MKRLRVCSDNLPEKEIKAEVLMVDDIEIDDIGIVKFDVYLNAREHKKVDPSGREMVKSFVRRPLFMQRKA